MESTAPAEPEKSPFGVAEALEPRRIPAAPSKSLALRIRIRSGGGAAHPTGAGTIVVVHIGALGCHGDARVQLNGSLRHGFFHFLVPHNKTRYECLCDPHRTTAGN